MKQDKYKPYVVAGLTGFLALAAAILLFFFLSHITVVLNFLGTVLRIMRPILMGIVIAFLLLPVYQFAFDALLVIRLNKPKSRRFVKLCSLVAVLMSLIFAVFLLYLFLYAIVPQIYGSVVGLVG